MPQNGKVKVPDIAAYIDDNHTRLTVEIALPGVPKEKINLRMHDDSLSLIAPRSTP